MDSKAAAMATPAMIPKSTSNRFRSLKNRLSLWSQAGLEIEFVFRLNNLSFKPQTLGFK